MPLAFHQHRRLFSCGEQPATGRQPFKCRELAGQTQIVAGGSSRSGRRGLGSPGFDTRRLASSRGASGFWVENGQISHPVNECTIAGNLRDMLMRLTPANDARDWRAVRVPSLLVEGMTVAGA